MQAIRLVQRTRDLGLRSIVRYTTTTTQLPSSNAPKWSNYGLHPSLIKHLCEKGFPYPFESQTLILNRLLAYQPTALTTQTGQGKTLAYLIPIINHFLTKSNGDLKPIHYPRAVILVPNRWLARQVAGIISQLIRALVPNAQVATHPSDLATTSCSTYFLVSTPNALVNHVSPSLLIQFLKHTEALVVDEADLLLSGSYLSATRSILGIYKKSITNSTMLVLTGATLSHPRSLKWPLAIAQTLIPNLKLISSPKTHAAVPQLSEQFIQLPDKFKDNTTGRAELIAHQLSKNQYEFSVAIVFTSKSHTVPILSELLQTLVPCCIVQPVIAHGPQVSDPIDILLSKPLHKPLILVATDGTLARGMDIAQVSLVIHHTFPLDAASYLHRIGRAARAGRQGTSIALVGPDDHALAREISILASHRGKVSLESMFSRNRSLSFRAGRAVLNHGLIDK